MRLAFRKIWRDLWIHKGRTLLVVLSIAVGVMALGLTLSSDQLMHERIDASRISSHPAQGRLILETPFDDDIVEAIANLPKIDQAEGWTSLTVRWKPSIDAPWQEA